MKKPPTGVIAGVDRSWIRRAAAREPSFDSFKVSIYGGLSNLLRKFSLLRVVIHLKCDTVISYV
jgi:hypothetical protein